MWKFAGILRRYRTLESSDVTALNAGTPTAFSGIFRKRTEGHPAITISALRAGPLRSPSHKPDFAPAPADQQSRLDEPDEDPRSPDMCELSAAPAVEPACDDELDELQQTDQDGAEVNRPFVEPSDEIMSRVSDGPAADAASAAKALRETLATKVVCPFCGQHKSTTAEPCPRCTMQDTPATRQATKARIGPWYVLQSRSPSAPGMKWSTLLWLVNKGHVTPRSIVRGPTSYQLWRYAAHVRGLSREFGLCYSCGGEVERTSTICPQCERPQEPPAEPDVLLDVRAASARQPIMREVREPQGPRAPKRNGERDSRPLRDPFDSRTPQVTTPVARDRADLSTRQRQEQLRRTGDGSIVSAMDLAAALQEPNGSSRRSRRGSFLNILLFILLLAGGAAAAVLYLKPEYRAPTAAWINSTWESLQSKAASLQWSSPPGEPPVSPPVTVAKPAPTPAPIPAPVVSNPAASGPPPVEREPEPQPAAQRQPPRIDPQQTKPKPQLSGDNASQDIELDRQPRVDRRTRQPPPEPPPPEPPKSIEKAMEESRVLWRQALDAEARQDFAAAVKYYQQMKQLPREAWHGGLEVSLELARERANQTAQKN